jgi:hypothetical protein
MTSFGKIDRVTVEFENRDGIPTLLVVKDTADLSVSIDVTDDGLEADFSIVGSIANGEDGYKFLGEDWGVSIDLKKAPPVAVARMAAPRSKSEFGPVGRWTSGVVALAILAPFVAILWAWAGSVFRSFQ